MLRSISTPASSGKENRRAGRGVTAFRPAALDPYRFPKERTDSSEGVMATDHQAEIAASAAALQDLGPGYDQALAEGLVERIGAEIDKRIAAEIANRITAGGGGRIP